MEGKNAMKRYYLNIKVQAISRLGSKCSACNETSGPLFVSCLEGNTRKGLSTIEVYRKVLEDASGFKLLCPKCCHRQSNKMNAEEIKYMESLDIPKILAECPEVRNKYEIVCSACKAGTVAISEASICGKSTNGYIIREYTCGKCKHKDFTKEKAHLN